MGSNDKAVALALTRANLDLFLLRAFPQLLPGAQYEHNWHIKAMCHVLEQVRLGTIRRLIITLPPRHLKSTIASVAFPAFLLGHDPTLRIIAASYGQELSLKLSLDTRQLMTSPWYAQLFPNTVLRAGQNTQELFYTTKNGSRMATSVGSSLTGFGGDLVIIDDPMKAEDAYSLPKRQGAIDWFQGTAATRLNHPERGAIVVVQQRLHEEDLAGVLLDGGGWVHLNLPAIAEDRQEVPVGNGQVWIRNRGDVLHPARMSKQALEQKEKEISSLHFSAQYQQRPVPAGGNLVRWDRFARYHMSDLEEVQIGDAIVQSWDIAVTVEEHSDYSVCLTFVYREERLYLWDVYRKKVAYPDLVRRIPALAKQANASTVIVEKAGVSLPLCQELDRQQQNRPGGRLYWYSHPKHSKEERLVSYLYLIEQGRVLLPEDAPWLSQLRQELAGFPNGRYKDQADALSQALKWLDRQLNQVQTRVTLVGRR